MVEVRGPDERIAFCDLDYLSDESEKLVLVISDFAAQQRPLLVYRVLQPHADDRAVSSLQALDHVSSPAVGEHEPAPPPITSLGLRPGPLHSGGPRHLRRAHWPAPQRPQMGKLII